MHTIFPTNQTNINVTFWVKIEIIWLPTQTTVEFRNASEALPKMFLTIDIPIFYTTAVKFILKN